MAGVMLRYTGTFLRRLRLFYRPKVSAPVYESLKALNIFKPYRLNRGGKGKLSSKGRIQTVVRKPQVGIVNNRLANLSNCISINILQSRVDRYRKYRIPIYRHQNTGKYRYTGIFNVFF